MNQVTKKLRLQWNRILDDVADSTATLIAARGEVLRLIQDTATLIQQIHGKPRPQVTSYDVQMWYYHNHGYRTMYDWVNWETGLPVKADNDPNKKVLDARARGVGQIFSRLRQWSGLVDYSKKGRVVYSRKDLCSSFKKWKTVDLLEKYGKTLADQRAGTQRRRTVLRDQNSSNGQFYVPSVIEKYLVTIARVHSTGNGHKKEITQRVKSFATALEKKFPTVPVDQKPKTNGKKTVVVNGQRRKLVK
jgi:hypothetical protein